MEQRVSLITLGVTDLERARAFYEGVIGWTAAPGPPGIAFFDLGGIVFSLYPHDDLARDTKAEAGNSGHGDYKGFALAHNVRTEDQVDAIFSRLRDAKATIIKPPERAFWGGYSGYFSDPDGHIWEIAHNPHWTIEGDGRISMTTE
ncbi:MAG: VOC family protein [Alphaproteobacteria bacterium]|jgi:hypothetical protein|nr:VOC family protein [Alphaproteobacteria bacterium]